jgi:DNA-binding NtrC family response regulator
VLIVAGNRPFARQLQRGLTSLGFAVWIAAEALESLGTYQQNRSRIEVILLSMDLQGLDGPGALSAFHQLDPGVRCCLLREAWEPYSTQDLFARGAAGILDMPLRLEGLALALRELATRPRLEVAPTSLTSL